jgi:hypothetical protein
MSGVIDKTGQQWEHCCQCGDFTKLEELHYAYSPAWPKYMAVDLCDACFNKNHKHYTHRFTVINNWKHVLWSDAMAEDASLIQYRALNPKLIDAARGYAMGTQS